MGTSKNDSTILEGGNKLQTLVSNFLLNTYYHRKPGSVLRVILITGIPGQKLNSGHCIVPPSDYKYSVFVQVFAKTSLTIDFLVYMKGS
jgi:hypothetical protein